MSGKVCCFVMALQMVILVATTTTTSRHLTPPTTNTLQSVHLHPLGPAQSPESSHQAVGKSFKEEEEEVGMSDMVSRRGWRKIGSSPPSCEHKCYGCFPCEAIQVPTTSKRSHFGIQYTNYEPEGWKCKCGPSFYSP